MTGPRAASQISSRTKRARTVWVSIIVLAAGITAFVAYNDVSTSLTPDDKVYAERFLRETGHGDVLDSAPPADFGRQVHTILAVQVAVLSIASDNVGIALNREREPSDLYRARSGLCCDRSRAIEKILSHLGFEVRHAAVYSLKETGSRLKSFLTPMTKSHAVTEVKTDRGWLVIDSNKRWVGLTREGEPVDLSQLQELQEMGVNRPAWDPRLKEPMSPILADRFTYLFGLYSRHGRFYPPFTPIPDTDWNQIGYNITG